MQPQTVETLITVVVTLLGSRVLEALVVWIRQRQKDKADAELVEAQADDVMTTSAERLLKMSDQTVTKLRDELHRLESRMSDLEVYLGRADNALMLIFSNPNIQRDYPTELRHALNVRRGDESVKIDDNITPWMFTHSEHRS